MSQIKHIREGVMPSTFFGYPNKSININVAVRNTVKDSNNETETNILLAPLSEL